MKGNIDLIDMVVNLTKHSYGSLSDMLNIPEKKLKRTEDLDETDLDKLNTFYFFLEENLAVPRHYTK